MLKYWKETSILLTQILIFYLCPAIVGSAGAIGMVLLMMALTLLLAFVMGIASGYKFKWLYPVLVAVLFIPSVFIYFNESALIHAVWYLVISSVGLSVGAITRWLSSK